MFLFASNIRAVFWVAVVPAGLAVLLIIFGVNDPAGDHADKKAHAPIRFSDIARLDRMFWSVVAIGAVFTLARFSEAFLILKASADGLSFALAPLVLVVMNIVYALGAYPAGALSDNFSTNRLLLLGAGTLVAADLLLAFSTNLFATFLGIALWGAAHGPYTRPVRKACCQARTDSNTRVSLRTLQSRHRSGIIICERHRRLALGLRWSSRYVSRWRELRYRRGFDASGRDSISRLTTGVDRPEWVSSSRSG